MTDRARRGIALTPMETRREVIVDTAVLADELGYELISVPEGWGFDSSVVLTEIALKTEQITVMSGILSVWGRTPGTIAMSAATLADVSGGRHALGLGASTKALVEGFHATPFEDPVGRLRETTLAVRQILDGERAPQPDEIDARPLKLGQPPQPDLPIYLAGLGEQSVQAAAELADGWFPYLVARDRFEPWSAEIMQARAESGRTDADFTVVAGPNLSVSNDAETGRAVVAGNLAWYVCAMGDAYSNSLVNQGYDEEVGAIQAANPSVRPGTGVIPAEAENLLEQVAIWGTPDTIGDALEAWDQVVDINTVGITPGLPWAEIEMALRAAAPA